MIFILFSLIYWLVGFYIIRQSSRFGARSFAVLTVSVKYVLCIVSIYFVLPFGGADGIRFDRLALEWSQGNLLDVFATVNLTQSYVISSITAVFYNLLGYNVFIPIIINGMMGIIIFYLSLKLASEVWDDSRIQKTFAMLLALHPVLNVNSAIILRENYILLFTMLALLQLVKFTQRDRFSNAAAFLIFVLLSSFFHGGMLLMALGLPLYVLLSSGNISRVKKYFVGSLFIASFAVIISTMEFGKLRDLQEGQVLNMEYLAELEQNRQEANTAYLIGLAPTSPFDLVWQAPIRFFYLLAKPFPWDVRSFGHSIVLLDAMLWWSILYLLYKNRRTITSNPAAMAILLSCAFTMLAFAYGTSNFGTGIRHRTKFLIIGLILVYPFLPKIRFGYAVGGSRKIGYR